MSTYTTEVRWIVETLSGGGDSIEKMIETARALIFDDYWTTYDPKYKTILEQKILRHYYTREIGFETYGLWKLKLNNELAEIMPRYNELYKAQEKMLEKLFTNTDLTESYKSSGSSTNSETGETNGTETGTENKTANGWNSDKTNGTDTKSTTQNNTQASEQATTNTTTASGTNNGDSWQTSNDTPQGALTGLETGAYMSSAVHNKNKTTSESSTNASTSGTSKAQADTTTDENGTSATTSEGKNGSSEENTKAAERSETRTNNTSGTTTSDYIKTLVGKNGGESYLDEYNKFVDSYNNIDKMIIDELNPLFMGLFE